jgi:hypothetical protein
MKLNELGAQRQTEQASRVIESQLGTKVNFAALGRKQAKTMLERVQHLLSEHRSKPQFHQSEKNPGYLQLLMLERGLRGRIAEQVPPGGVGSTTANDPAAAARTQATMQMRKRQIQDMIRAKQQEIAQLQRQMSSPTLGLAESVRRALRESELQQAQVVLAAQDMIDQVQKMLEQISAMQFKDLPALTDAIKNDVGPEQATQFQSSASQALTNLLTSLQQGKTELEGAQGVLTGQAPQVPGADAGVDTLPPPEDAGGDLEADLSIDANLPPEEEDEEEISGAALGRERR